jgi:hypothetical protein
VKPAEVGRQPAAEAPPAQGGRLDAPLPAERPDKQLAEPAAASSPSSPKTQVINERPADPAPAAREPQQVARATAGSGYAPPPAPPADPLRQRAEAAGLHPEISRAVLRRLSAADLRNAGVAIETALAQTSDTDVLAWPRQRKPDEALFRVHFVAGAAPECRRYVVTVTKDGWSTTALPMERCGVKRVALQQR